MQSMLHRPTSAPAAATNGSANNNKVEQNQNDEESLEESLDSLHSSRSMESLDKLPPFSPLTPLGTPSKSTTNRRLWKSSSRSSAASAGGGSSKSIASDKNSSSTGKDVDNSNGKSKSFRMSTKLFSSSSPKRLFNSSTTSTTAKTSEKKDGEKAGSTLTNAQTTAPTTPSIPLSTISHQQHTSILSPLTPITTSMNNSDTNVLVASSNNSTPRTANNITKDGDEDEEGVAESLDHINQPAIEEDEIQEEGAKSSDNDVELKSALDSLGRNVKELRCLSPTAASAKSSNNDDIVHSPNTEGYNEFLSLIGRNATAENVEQSSMTNESSDIAVVVDYNDTTENEEESNDCQCQWCPEPILKLLRGCSNANNNRSAISDVPQQSQQQESNARDIKSSNVKKIHQSIRSVRTDLTAIMEHAQMTPEHKELILSEVYVIQNSLDKISSVSMNSSVDKS